MPNHPQNLSSDDLPQVVRQELKNYHQFDTAPHQDLMSFRSIKNQLETLSQPNAIFAKRMALNTVFQQLLREVYKEHKNSTTLIQKRYLERVTIPDVASHFHVSQATISRWTDKAIEITTKKLLQMEEGANDSWYNRLTALLPARYYDRLVGVDKLRDQLVAKIINPDGPRIIALSGIGGIGKSSLADYVVRQALRSGAFLKVAWVTFRPDHDNWILSNDEVKAQFIRLLAHAVDPKLESLPTEKQIEHLADSLQSEAHLIVVDNLDEQDETDTIIQCINGIGKPSRFIVTTRAQPARTSCLVANLTELSRNDSLDMMQYYLESTGQTQIGETNEETLNKIFQIVGGNPLALKITAGLMQWLPLEKILLDLNEGRGNASVIYKTIFLQTWETLTPDSKLLLQTMSLTNAASGASAAQMQERCGLADTNFWQAVNELILRSLLEVRGPVNNRSYGIHQLTKTFIETEITG